MIPSNQSRVISPEVPSSAPIRLLMIDDDLASIERLKQRLESMRCFEIHASDSPLLGVELARQLRPDIILLDIVMPMYDGGDIRTMLRRNPELRNIPVIMVSSLIAPGETNKEGFVRCGEDIMMAKPAVPGKLIALIEKILSGKMPPLCRELQSA